MKLLNTPTPPDAAGTSTVKVPLAQATTVAGFGWLLTGAILSLGTTANFRTACGDTGVLFLLFWLALLVPGRLRAPNATVYAPMLDDEYPDALSYGPPINTDGSVMINGMDANGCAHGAPKPDSGIHYSLLD